MREDYVMRRSSSRVNHYIQKYVTLAGAEKREEVIELFDNMLQLFPQWVIMTCPVMHPEICYVSSNAIHIFGYDMEYIVRNCRPEQYFAYVHEDDQHDLQHCFAHIHDSMEGIPPDRHQEYRSVLHYRFKTKNGNFIYLQDERATLQLKESGNLYYTLIRDVTEERIFNGVKLEMYHQQETMKKIREYKPSAVRNPLSKRELELVALIKQGMSVKEIAYHLNISHHTVRNIKSRMFEKFGVRSTVELLNMTA